MACVSAEGGAGCVRQAEERRLGFSGTEGWAAPDRTERVLSDAIGEGDGQSEHATGSKCARQGM